MENDFLSETDFLKNGFTILNDGGYINKDLMIGYDSNDFINNQYTIMNLKTRDFYKLKYKNDLNPAIELLTNKKPTD